MNNSQTFNKLIQEYLKKDNKYCNEITNFKNYLNDRNLEEKVFNLNVTHIDEYFVYSFDAKIGAVPTLTTHISALKSFFDFLIQKEFDFKELYGYIDTAGYKEKLTQSLDNSVKKQLISKLLLRTIIEKMDNYITQYNDDLCGKRKRNKFMHILISQLFIKLSLILPIKPKEMLKFTIDNIKDCQSQIIHNNTEINLPKNLRKDIIYAIEYANTFNDTNYKFDSALVLFDFLYSCLGNTVDTSSFSGTLQHMYEAVGLIEMQKKGVSSKKKKTMYLYPPESYKNTAIVCMLENGVSLVYLKKLTGISYDSLLSNYDFSKTIDVKDMASVELNKIISITDYYSYL